MEESSPLTYLPPVRPPTPASRPDSRPDLLQLQEIKTAPETPPHHRHRRSPTALAMMISAGPTNQQAQPAAQPQPTLTDSAQRASAFVASAALPQFNWQPPSRRLSTNAASLVANPLEQIQRPAETNTRDSMIGKRPAAPMAVLQQVNAAQQAAVHFASPVQQVYTLTPESSPATDPRVAQLQSVVGTLNPNAVPFNPLWNTAVTNILPQPNEQPIGASLPLQINRSGSISRQQPPLNLVPVASHTSIMSFQPAQPPPQQPDQNPPAMQPPVQLPHRRYREQVRREQAPVQQPLIELAPDVNQQAQLARSASRYGQHFCSPPADPVIQNLPAVQTLPAAQAPVRTDHVPHQSARMAVQPEVVPPFVDAQAPVRTDHVPNKQARMTVPEVISPPVIPQQAWPTNYRELLQRLDAEMDQAVQQPLAIAVLEPPAPMPQPPVQQSAARQRLSPVIPREELERIAVQRFMELQDQFPQLQISQAQPQFQMPQPSMPRVLRPLPQLPPLPANASIQLQQLQPPNDGRDRPSDRRPSISLRQQVITAGAVV